MEIVASVRWLKRALKQLEQEVDYLAQENPKAAAKLLKQVQQQTLLLQDHPHMGWPGRVAGTRELVMTQYSYFIPYRCKHKQIEVLRFFHTARQYPPK
jgi:toxin ParE1/3/4